MAIAHVHADVISRAKGKSAVAAAAYRAGDKLYNEHTGETYDYTHKREIVHSVILAPASAPDWVYNRQTLWNEAERCETRSNSQTARQIEIALPRELTREQNIELAKVYAQTLVAQGMVVDLNIHDKGDGNPHAHLMMATRSIDENGFGQKVREWDKKDALIEWRKEYENVTNQFLEKYGHEMRISVKSYVEQGIDQEATIHYGHYAHQLEEQGVRSERGDINREIEARNREREAIKQEMAGIQEQRKQEEVRMEQEEERQEKKKTITEAELQKRFEGWVEVARQELQKEQPVEEEEKKNQSDIWKTLHERTAHREETERQAARFEEMTKVFREMQAKIAALRTFQDEWNLNEQRLDRFQAVEVKRELTEKEKSDYQRTLDHAEVLWKMVVKAFPEYWARGQPYIDTQEMQEDLLRYQKAADAMRSFLDGIVTHQHLQERLESLGVDLSRKHMPETQQAWSELQALREDRRAIEQNRVVMILPRICGRRKASDILFPKEGKDHAKSAKDLHTGV